MLKNALADERQIMSRASQSSSVKSNVRLGLIVRTPTAYNKKMPLFDEAGHIVGTFGISRDVTQLKRVSKMLCVMLSLRQNKPIKRKGASPRENGAMKFERR